MSYYEELGVEPGASTEEIRRAYKRLTRLMHPDHQADPELRAAAERQMRRLNQIEEILTNPGARARYDRELALGGAVLRSQIPAGERRRSLSMGWVWVLSLIAVIILVAVWFPADSERATVSMPAAAPPVSSVVAASRGNEPAKQLRSRAAGASLAATRPVPPPVVQKPVVGEETATPVPRDPEPAVLPPVHAPPLALGAASVQPAATVRAEPASRKPGLAGQWIYARSADDRTDAKLYPPEYIELRVVQDNGRLSGNYQARYFVSNRAVSPNVTFRFEGEVKDGGEYTWEGAGGARGKVELRLTGSQSMEVNWFATEMGTQLGLGSGSATLYRRQDP